MTTTVINALRRFLPAHLREHRHAMGEAQRRAVWAITHCRGAEMGGHLHACGSCGKREFHFHSCNHRSCPQCGKQATADWVKRELNKRVGAPYFMVTFTLPEELRPLFFTPHAKAIYQLFFASASSALSDTLANSRWLGAATSGFTLVLHTWNQRLQFHPHLHCIVPGAGINAAGRVVRVKNANFLVPQPVLRSVFRARFRDGLADLAKDLPLPAIDPAIWKKDWGIHLQPFGSGENIIKYLGRYVCRTAIGDSRILSITDTHVSFRWKDRAHGNAPRSKPSLVPNSSPVTSVMSCRANRAPCATMDFVIPPPRPSASASPSTPADRCSSAQPPSCRKSHPTPSPVLVAARP